MDFGSARSELVEACCRRVCGDAGDLDPATRLEDLRSLRMACTRPDEAHILLESGLIPYLFRHSSSLVRSSKLQDVLGDEERCFNVGELCSQISLMVQVVANFAANKGKFLEMVWTSAGDEGFQDMIELARLSGKRGILAAAIAGMYNCVCGDDDDAAARLDSFTRNRKLCSHLLLSIPLPLKASSVHTAGAVPPPSAPCPSIGDDPALEWMHMLVVKVVSSGRLRSLLACLAPRAPATSEGVWSTETEIVDLSKSDVVTHEQLTLLHCVEDVLEDQKLILKSRSTSVLSDFQNVVSYLIACIIKPLCEFSLSIADLEFSSSLAVAAGPVTAEGVSGPEELQKLLVALKIVYLSPKPKDGEIDLINRSCCSSFIDRWNAFVNSRSELTLVLAVISSAMCFMANPDCGFSVVDVQNSQEKFAKDGLVAACVCCLPHRIELLGKEESVDIEKRDMLMNDVKRQIAREALRCLANALYSCTFAQEELRLIQGLQIVLVNCTTDFNNPLSREWALLCVRNACAGNIKNQEFIEEFKLQNVVQSDHLTEKGLDVKLDTLTGKFHVEKIE